MTYFFEKLHQCPIMNRSKLMNPHSQVFTHRRPLTGKPVKEWMSVLRHSYQIFNMFYQFYFLCLLCLLSHSNFCSSTFSFLLRLGFQDFKNLLKHQGSNWGKHGRTENNFYYAPGSPQTTCWELMLTQLWNSTMRGFWTNWWIPIKISKHTLLHFLPTQIHSGISVSKNLRNEKSFLNANLFW